MRKDHIFSMIIVSVVALITINKDFAGAAIERVAGECKTLPVYSLFISTQESGTNVEEALQKTMLQLQKQDITTQLTQNKKQQCESCNLEQERKQQTVTCTFVSATPYAKDQWKR